MTAHPNLPRKALLRPLSLAVLAAFPPLAMAADPGACVTTHGVTGAGPWPNGISVTGLATPYILNVYDLTATIAPISGTAGITLRSIAGNDLTACTGAALAPIGIRTANAGGVVLWTVGRPAAPIGVDPLFHVALPGSGDAQGGRVLVVNRLDIETSGVGAHGITVSSQTEGYGTEVTTPLRDFDADLVTFRVTALATPQGAAAMPGGSVAARVVNALESGDSKTGYTRTYGAELGHFSVAADGSVVFTLSDAERAGLGLVAGHPIVVTADLTVQGQYRPSVAAPFSDAGLPEPGRVSARLSLDEQGQLVIATTADFDRFGTVPLASPDTKALPDVRAFLQAKADEAGAAGGGGGFVRAEHLAGLAPASRVPPLARITTHGADSHGILAESRGVNGIAGGNGGGFWTFGFVRPTGGTDGRQGGRVEVQVDGAIETFGDGSAGVLARSIGGVGGRGGEGGTYYFGASGGKGGNGGAVEVTGSGRIDTHGKSAPGIFAVSQGGSGGNGGGGDVFTGGGVGSSGGTSSLVDVRGSWTVNTTGDESYGIWAKSAGGQGGQGGDGGWLTGAAKPGAASADGGPVNLRSGGTVTTGGTSAYALFGQSVGGFGGQGGDDPGLIVAHGGSGGSAGSGGTVTVENGAGGILHTGGIGAHALVAQSIGGGGGMGGGPGPLPLHIIDRAGDGAYGGNGGAVTAINAGTITTDREEARGIFAQSVGGGGGDGGAAIGISSTGGAGGGIGGIGSGFSSGQGVLVRNTGSVTTAEAGSAALFAQSIGGGGGNGGPAAGWRSVGGNGGSGGHAGLVTVEHSGALKTGGENATALFAQSIGGGGGTGGASIAAGALGAYALGGRGAQGGNGSDVVVTSSGGTIDTDGVRSRGIFAQSVGGGGGDGGFSMASSVGPGAAVSLAIGGQAGPGGDAGTVKVTNAAAITTLGADAPGLFAESVGGGGGNGGYAISGATGGAFAASFALGGNGATGGIGRQAGVENHGAISTSGAGSVGLQAQSIGGGGGNGGFSLGVSAGGLAAVTMTLGGSAGSGGAAGRVQVENSGTIATGDVARATGAHALMAQSVGGGGGNGGFSVALAAGGFGGGSLSLGGNGGGGGAAGTVSVDNAGALETWQAKSIGLIAQSIGGGGGNGGFAVSGAASLGAALNLALGGKGTGGGDAGGDAAFGADRTVSVDVRNRGAIDTWGAASVGLLAQSVGGGGGNGGFASTLSAGGMAGFGAGLGGSAADGGDGKSVQVVNDGAIRTHAGDAGPLDKAKDRLDNEQAHALLAQSVGGGGGNGGFAFDVAAGGFGAGTLSLGGTGGGGGDGGAVRVENHGTLQAAARGSNGLLAQSVGGGGGNGGFAISASGSGGASLGLTLGGAGRSGGTGGTVEVANTGEITTLAERSSGLQAQSIGGGGGNGGFAVHVGAGGIGALSLALGGSGAGGNDAAAVDVTNGVDPAALAQAGQGSAAITTHGLASHALFAQSIGGGGGNGGFAVDLGAGGIASGSLALGGSAARGGAAGTVDVTNWGRLGTNRDGSIGLFAQSVGGGGGNGGFALAGALGGSAALSLGMGGSGGSGGSAAAVTVANHGGIETAGEQSHGLVAQSVGGGGGDGGFAVTLTAGGGAALGIGLGGGAAGGGVGRTVTVTNDGAITTDGPQAHAIFAQSLGGGGGNGGFAVSAAAGGFGAATLALGGQGGAGSAGGEVRVTNGAALDTTHDGSIGLLAQSVGGGGGNGGFAVSAAAGSIAAVGISLGGNGGDGGNADLVHVENAGRITTDGAESHAVFVQSVGGGGGSGGFAVSASAGIASASVVLGGSGASGGTPGTVYAKNTAALTTQAAGSVGLYAQSVGGGGGRGGFAIGLGAGQVGTAVFTLGGTGGGGAEANTVTVDNAGTIETHGDGSIGLQAQSVGGGGGNGGFSVGVAGGGVGALNLSIGGGGGGAGGAKKVDATNTAAISTDGVDAHALFAQSIGGGGGNGGFGIGIGAGGTAAGSIVIGGSGAGGGAGGEVAVDNRGALTTSADKAVGLYAQSVGGGGGNGGFAISGAGAGTGALAFALGGKGDGGGAGSTVTVTSRADVATGGADAHGLFAQSVGGGGGNGGFAIAVGGAGTASGAITIGGSGAGGGSGGAVAVTQAGRIETAGANAIGVFAQSVGGGGGNGGFTIGAAGAGTASGTLALGGKSGGGGVGGTVALTTEAGSTVITQGEKAFGLIAQSVGGGGGNGGFSIAGAGAGQGSGSLSLGGKGGAGGSADAVTLNSASDVSTAGAGAVGVFAQSIGGGGGNGGFAFSGALGTRLALSVAVGGKGGEGGGGDTVDLDSRGTVRTAGAAASAIQAQSVGRGGGNGGMAVALTLASFTKSGVSAEVTVGGDGGTGGIGSDVTVGHAALDRAVSGTLATGGDGAHGIFAQSVGGGGGQGGAALGLSFTNDIGLAKGAKALSATLNFGGSAGSGNTGGSVTVANAAGITTAGANAHGIFAQSLGGGGGTNGGAETIALSTSALLPFKEVEGKSYGLEITAGGNAGSGNVGGAVTVTNSGNITTAGTASRGIFAQSVGGGGGAVTEGVTGTVGDWIDEGKNVLSALGIAKSFADLFKKKSDASGFVPSSLTIKLGANEGSGANADVVTVHNRADIATQGLGAHAILAQSVGAGGGDANAYAEGLGGGQDVETGVGLVGEFAIGGAGGAAGSGGRVGVDHAGSLFTTGVQAHGIFAQSVGGGGGSAGNVSGGFAGADSIGLGVGIGQKGGSGGNGGAVAVHGAGAIETRGERSIGILAQSIGGGGGSAGTREGLAFFGSAGGRGSGGAVDVLHEGTVVTTGLRAHGILAQSAGGSTGSVTSNGVTTNYAGGAGTVGVTVRGGGVWAEGDGADGIVAQSVAAVDGAAHGGAQAVTVAIEQSVVRGGLGDAAGVRLLDGSANEIANRGGWIGTRAGVDGLAIAATGGDDTLRNTGLVTGRIDLGAGRNAVVNAAGGQVDMGSSLHLGAGNTLTNQGTLSPLGRGRIGTTALTGDLVQQAGGTLVVDVDLMTGQADRIDASGRVDLGGAVRLLPVRPAPAAGSIVLASAGDALDAAALDIDASRSAVARYVLAVRGRELRLDYRIDFSDVAGLNANQRRFGAHVNAIQAAGGTAGFAPIADALYAQPEAASLARSYDGLGAASHTTLPTVALMSSLQFGDAMLSCRRSDGEARFVREGECGWAAATVASLKQRGGALGLGFDRSAGGFAAGWQREIAPQWHLGLAFGIEHAVTDTGSFATARGDQVQAGAMLKWRSGETTVSGGLEASRGRYDVARRVALPAGEATATSAPRLSALGAHLRLGHTLPRGGWYLRPMIDVAATRVVQHGFDESGAGVANLAVARSSQMVWTLRPALEVGGEIRRADGTLLRPYVRVGALRLASGVPQVQASLQGIPAGIAPFMSESAVPRSVGELALGVDLLDVGGTVLRFGYSGQFARRLDAHAAQLKVSMPF